MGLDEIDATTQKDGACVGAIERSRRVRLRAGRRTAQERPSRSDNRHQRRDDQEPHRQPRLNMRALPESVTSA